MATTIKVHDKTKPNLKLLAALLDKSMMDVLDELVDKALAERGQTNERWLILELEQATAEIDRLRRAIEQERGCEPGTFDPFTFHEGPLFEGMP
jgi:hypothetical protein